MMKLNQSNICLQSKPFTALQNVLQQKFNPKKSHTQEKTGNKWSQGSKSKERKLVHAHTPPHTPPTHTHHIHTPMYRSEPQQVAKTAMGPAQWTCRKGQFAKRFWEVAVIISMPDSEMCILSSADFMSCYQDAAFQSTCMLAGMAFSVAPEEMRWFRFSGNLEKA